MEIIILVIVIMVVWTNEVLLGKPIFQPPKKPPTPDEKFADAIKEYLKQGIKIRDK